MILAATAIGQDLTYPARHAHLRKGGEGTLAISAGGIRWTETGKKANHSQAWKYEDIQRLELAPGALRVLTYEDNQREFGRDRVYLFDHVPKEAAPQIYALLAPKLDQRFVAHIAGPVAGIVYETPARLLHGRYGANGILKVGTSNIVFEGAGESRAWRYSDIDSVSSSGTFELTFNTIEGENRFQLKQPLERDRYDDLWRRLTEASGLILYPSQLEMHHHEQTH
jgi:hypothetical protein